MHQGLPNVIHLYLTPQNILQILFLWEHETLHSVWSEGAITPIAPPQGPA